MGPDYEAIQTDIFTDKYLWCLCELGYFLPIASDNQWEFSYPYLLRVNEKYPNFPDRTHFLVGSELSDINRGNEISHFPSLNILQYTPTTHNNNSSSSSLLFTLIYTGARQQIPARSR